MKSTFPKVRLANVAVVFSGYAFKSSDLFPIAEFPVVKIANIQNKQVSRDCATYLPSTLMSDKLDRFRLRHGDILVAMTGAGSVGKFGRMRTVDRPYLVNQRVGIIRAETSKANPDYLYYTLSLDQYEKVLYGYGLGAGQPNVSPSQVGSLDIPFPSLRTQRKVAAILSAYDDLIENNTRRIAILEEMAQAIYREWFVHFRFPGHDKVKLIDSPVGKIPQGWKAEPLSKVADVNALSIKKGKEPEEVNYVDIASVSTGRIDEVRLLPFAEAPGRARRIVRHGDVIWSTVRPNRKSYSLILNPDSNMIASTGFAVISGIKAPFSYLYYALTTDDFVAYLVNHATGSAYPAVNSSDFEKATILVPAQDVLAAFHEITEPMFLAKHCVSEKNTTLRASRDLLLPKLISGQLDVEELDIETGEPLTEATA